MKDLASFAKKKSWLLVMLMAGILLLLTPGKTADQRKETEELFTLPEQRLAEVLAGMEGVGEVKVLLAEKPGRDQGFAGAVVVCSGAEDPDIRLRIVETVSAFTGLGSNKIAVEKMVS